MLQRLYEWLRDFADAEEVDAFITQGGLDQIEARLREADKMLKLSLDFNTPLTLLRVCGELFGCDMFKSTVRQRSSV
jgi:hypothetical protein